MAPLRSALLAALLLGSSGCGGDLNVGSAHVETGLDAGALTDAEGPRDRANDDRLERLAQEIGGTWELSSPWGATLFRLHVMPKPGTRSGEWTLECVAADWPCVNRPMPPDAGLWVDEILKFLDRPSGTYWFHELAGPVKSEGVFVISVGGALGFTYDSQLETLAWGATFTRAGNGRPKSDGGAP
jgi:hypothetical protein